jgi:hypothetical protein
MHNVYYRFRHMAGKPIYGEKPASLRMNRLMQPATNRLRAATVYAAAVALEAGETPETESPAVGARCWARNAPPEGAARRGRRARSADRSRRTGLLHEAKAPRRLVEGAAGL